MKSFVVIGCGRFGSSIARTLYSLGNEVLAIDSSEEIIKEISEEVTHAVQADVMDETVLMVKDLGIDKVIAKAQSELHGKVLSKIGADKIIFPERDMGVRVAHNLASTNILDFIELSPDYSILEIAALKEWEEKSLAQLRLPSKYGINVMAIKRGDSIKVSPNGEVIIKKDDILVIIGNTKDIKRVEQRAGE